VAVLVVLFAAATTRLFIWPAQGMPPHVSAIVVFAGPGERLPVALRLAREHRAPVLVVSQGQHGYGGPCPPAVPGVRLTCFDPDPGNTRGEAEFVGRLAKQYHWNSMVLVTGTEQDTRARLLMKRCFGGSVYVVAGSLPLHYWPFQIAYEWGALLKALVVQRSC
jgi:uncharacterized SAM-binding protein YcdF (DUF218 family)